MFAKMNIACTEKRTLMALAKYVDCEKDVKLASTAGSSSEFVRMSLILWGDIFAEVDRMVDTYAISFHHSSGSTADRVIGNRKYDQLNWTERLDKVFPFYMGLLPNFHFLTEADVTILEPGQELPVKVITVPKTLKTPRIIAMEPVYMQYAQQGILHALLQAMQPKRYPSSSDNATSFFLGFPDPQAPNQELARIGSRQGSYATLDLSDASDRVSNQHVVDLLHYFPSFSEAVAASRSTKADVSGYGVMPLSKFASMGSALCFPFEALVFATVVFLGIQDVLSRPLTVGDIKSFHGKVRVFGDDIIVPIEYTQAVVDRLESFGFKVNYAKSFWTGKFRESCGKEYYDGYPVDITRVRCDFPTTKADVDQIVGTVSLRNRLDRAVFPQSIKYIDSVVRKFLPYYPEVYPTSSILGRHTEHPSFEGARMCPSLQVPLVRGCVAKSRLPVSKLEGYGALMKFFLKRSKFPYEDGHLQHSGRSVSVNMKSGWYPVGKPTGLVT
jgi:hypothetical protein